MKKYISYILLVFTLLAFSLNCAAAAKPFTVVIDAGHGGHDTGACDNGAREKDINLGVALKLGDLIKKNLKDVKVVYTRSDDTFRSLQQRADIANQAKGDLFISVHTNSIDKNSKNRSTVEGSQVYALGLHKDAENMKVARRENSVINLEKGDKSTYQGFDPNKDESYIVFEMAQKKNLQKSLNFANDVEKELTATAKRKNRGVHQAGFWVLWATSMPSVLVELDFICNPTSSRYMTSSNGQLQLAKAIYNAVERYYDREAKTSSTPASRQSTQKRTQNSTGKGKSGKSRSNRSKKSKSNITAAEPDETPAQETVAEELISDETVALLPEVESSRSFEHTFTAPEKVYSSASGRRRRNSKGREKSEQLIASVAEVPVRTEKDYLAKTTSRALVMPVAEESKPAAAPAKKKKSTKRSKSGSHLQKLTDIYSIELLASEKQLSTSDPVFKGLKSITSNKINNTVHYYYGRTEDRNEIETLYKQVKHNFPDAKITRQKIDKH